MDLDQLSLVHLGLEREEVLANGKSFLRMWPMSQLSDLLIPTVSPEGGYPKSMD